MKCSGMKLLLEILLSCTGGVCCVTRSIIDNISLEIVDCTANKWNLHFVWQAGLSNQPINSEMSLNRKVIEIFYLCHTNCSKNGFFWQSNHYDISVSCQLLQCCQQSIMFFSSPNTSPKWGVGPTIDQKEFLIAELQVIVVCWQPRCEIANTSHIVDCILFDIHQIDFWPPPLMSNLFSY